MEREIKIFELFAGIGSPRKAFENLGINYKSLGYSEIDKHAIRSYCAIHGDSEKNNFGDITQIEELPKGLDVVFHGSPCQDFSNAGLMRGGDLGSGTRSSLMYETLRLVRDAKPKVVVWENVKGVLAKRNKHNFDNYIETLNELGYTSSYRIIEGTDVGVPQTRPRIIVVSVLGNEEYKFNLPKVDVKPLSEYVSFTNEKEVIVNVSQATKQQYIELLTPGVANLAYPSSKTRRGRVVKNGSIVPTLQTSNELYVVEVLETISEEQQKREWEWNAQEKPYKKVLTEDSICPTLTTRSGDNTSSKKLISLSKKNDLQGTYEPTIRQLTPREMYKLMGFSDDDYLKANLVSSQAQLAKQAGNSIIVDVMENIIKNLDVVKGI